MKLTICIILSITFFIAIIQGIVSQHEDRHIQIMEANGCVEGMKEVNFFSGWSTCKEKYVPLYTEWEASMHMMNDFFTDQTKSLIIWSYLILISLLVLFVPKK